MKKILSIILATVLCFSVAACSQKLAGPKFETYGDLLLSVQSDTEKESFPAVIAKDDEMAQSVFAMMGISEDDVDSFAVACSFMNVNAYCVAIIKPVSGKAADIEDTLKNYVELTKSNMENYLPDQFEIAQKAQVEKTKNGEIILVMNETVTDTLEKIKSSL